MVILLHCITGMIRESPLIVLWRVIILQNSTLQSTEEYGGQLYIISLFKPSVTFHNQLWNSPKLLFAWSKVWGHENGRGVNVMMVRCLDGLVMWSLAGMEETGFTCPLKHRNFCSLEPTVTKKIIRIVWHTRVKLTLRTLARKSRAPNNCPYYCTMILLFLSNINIQF